MGRKFLLSFILLMLSLAFASVSYSYTPTLHPMQKEVVMRRLAFYESSGRHNIYGDLDKPFVAYGLYQYQHRTFVWLCRLAGFKRFNWQSKENQIVLTSWAIDHGFGYLWGRNYRRALKDASRVNILYAVDWRNLALGAV